MLVLLETASGYALFKVLDDGKIKDSTDLSKEFETPEKASKIVALKSFQKFENTTEALAAATALVESELPKGLKKFLQKTIVEEQLTEKLAVQDSKLGVAIKEQLGIKRATGTVVNELFRGIRYQFEISFLAFKNQTWLLCLLG